MEVAKMVLVGKVNKEIVGLINHKGTPAVGLCGDDGGLMQARRLVRTDAAGDPIDLGLVGEVTHVNTALLDLLEADYVPVVASVGVGPDGESYNINADNVAAALGAALQAEKVVFLTDVAGLYRDVADESSLVSECDADEVRALIAAGKASKGMIPKLEAVLAALDGGCGGRTHHRRAGAALGPARDPDRRLRRGHESVARARQRGVEADERQMRLHADDGWA